MSWFPTSVRTNRSLTAFVTTSADMALTSGETVKLSCRTVLATSYSECDPRWNLLYCVFLEALLKTQPDVHERGVDGSDRGAGLGIRIKSGSFLSVLTTVRCHAVISAQGRT